VVSVEIQGSVGVAGGFSYRKGPTSRVTQIVIKRTIYPLVSFNSIGVWPVNSSSGRSVACVLFPPKSVGHIPYIIR
jgi:hypothetical protein